MLEKLMVLCAIVFLTGTLYIKINAYSDDVLLVFWFFAGILAAFFLWLSDRAAKKLNPKR